MSKKKEKERTKRKAGRNQIEWLAAQIADEMAVGLFGRTEEYAEHVAQYYTAAVDELLKLSARTELDAESEVFSFSSSKRMSEKSNAILRGLYSAVYQEIRSGVIREWEFANNANDRMAELAMGKGTKDDSRFARLFARNRDAMEAFFSRKSEYGGLNLSQKVWKYTSQFKEEMELALSASLGRGDSAATVSRHVRQYMQEPDRLFRRVRDEKGNLKLSKRAAAYHPGRGEYRSSYKNAMRLARTETNMAYRAADNERRQQHPWIIGVEVKRSKHKFPCKICERLTGRYPKDFDFRGWHPQCRCYTTDILASEDEIIAYRRAMLNGEDVSNWQFSGQITDLPDSAREWILDNSDRIEQAAANDSLPYWIKDNPKYIKTREATNNGHADGSSEPSAKKKLMDERSKEYTRLCDDPDYSDVHFDRQNGGLMATHKDHKIHENDNKRYFAEQLNGDELEKEFQQLAFGRGHSVIFRAEAENTTDLDMLLDGVKMDLVSVTANSTTFCAQLRRKNRQLRNYNMLYGEENSSVCMYFHEPSYYSYEKIEAGLNKLKGYGAEILIKKIFVLLNDGTDIFELSLP